MDNYRTGVFEYFKCVCPSKIVVKPWWFDISSPSFFPFSIIIEDTTDNNSDFLKKNGKYYNIHVFTIIILYNKSLKEE